MIDHITDDYVTDQIENGDGNVRLCEELQEFINDLVHSIETNDNDKVENLTAQWIGDN